MPDRHWALKQNEGSGEWLDAAAAAAGNVIDIGQIEKCPLKIVLCVERFNAKIC